MDSGYSVVLLTSPGERHQADAISEAYGQMPIDGDNGDVLRTGPAHGYGHGCLTLRKAISCPHAPA